MRIEVGHTSPSGGGGGSFALVGEFLVHDLPDVGPAVEVVEADMLVTSRPRGQRQPSDDDFMFTDDAALEAHYGEIASAMEPSHEAERARGNRLTFRRKQHTVALSVVSDLSERDAWLDAPTPEVFATAARELVAALAPLAKRVTGADDFDAPAFLAHLRGRLDDLPADQVALDLLMEQLQEASARRWDAMDGWCIVNVDWGLYAPGTRERLDDPFFFSGDEFAPHGNDAGADFLAGYLRDRPADTWAYLQGSAREHGFASLDEFADADAWEHDEVVIAAAFAEVMVAGASTLALKERALVALARRDAEFHDPRYALMQAALG
jgi:hypothetical protein